MLVRNLRSVFLFPAVLFLAFVPLLRAEEGMWAFDNPP
jgi:hypothetical protein